ncbi:MAG: keto-deoxy-phosphogluconate aldolase, partial [Luminiphilus sp.]
MAVQTDQFLSRLVCPVIPVIVLDRVDHAVPLAEALFSGGVSALELTLRTE